MKKIAVTGYGGTGSSAVIDLLSEYSSCTTCNLNQYEHVLFYSPNSLFDLEDKLLLNNDTHRSDEAISSFLIEINRLYSNNFEWFGSYKFLFGSQFLDIIDDFIKDIGVKNFKGSWFGQYKKPRSSLYKKMFVIAKIVLKNKIIYRMIKNNISLEKNGINRAFPTSNEFYMAGKKFIKAYFNMVDNGSNKNIVFDHLLLPHNAYRLPNYFDDDFRLIIVDRDIRDMYILLHYIWPRADKNSLLSNNKYEFIDFWKRMRMCEKQIDDFRILRLQFEDLIYQYDKTVERIENFIGLNKNDHINRKKHFNPDLSIKNTQNYTINVEWEKEVEDVEHILSKYIYNFPFKIQTSIEETFD